MNVTIGHYEPGPTRKFTLVLFRGNATELVEIHQVDMDGWMLYECYLLPSYELHCFSWDEEAEELQWLNMENEPLTEEIATLRTELSKYQRPAA